MAFIQSNNSFGILVKNLVKIKLWYSVIECILKHHAFLTIMRECGAGVGFEFKFIFAYLVIRTILSLK